MGEILSSIGQVIEMGLRAAFYSIGSFVYQAIIYMYNLFEKLCNGRFLDSELLESFSERIGLILGLLMFLKKEWEKLMLNRGICLTFSQIFM